MRKEKLKEQYESVELKLILFEFSDLITTSSGVSAPGLDLGDMENDGWS